MSIPMLDLKAQYDPILVEVRAAIDRVLATHRYIGGPEIEELEGEIARHCGTRHAVGLSSGTDALMVALMALGVGPGDEVITTPFTFFATAGSIWRLGAKPRFVDIEPRTYNLDPGKVAAAITPRTKAIMPVHLFGQCADVAGIERAIGGRPIAIVEDCAQAIGAERDGKRAGAMGRIGAFSFFPSKNLGGIGDGGMITTDDEALAGRIRMLRSHGGNTQYVHEIVGGNFRLDTINAAVLRVKLPHLDGWTQARQRNAERYRRLFAAAGLTERGVVAPIEDPTARSNRHVYNQFVCRFAKRDAVKQALVDRQIGCAVYYPIPLHLQQCFGGLGYRRGDFPEAERAATEVLALPIFSELSEAQATAVVAAIDSVC
jgi:dTDP-4-amino-4,6-dideoxygalactose transaminase